MFFKQRKLKYLDNYLREIISTKTGFDKDKIKLIKSKKSKNSSVDLDYHKFKYQSKIYILNKDNLKCIK